MTTLISRTAVVCLLLAVALPVHAQEGEMPPMGAPAEMQQVAYFLGDWDVAVKMKMEPGGPWMESEATATSSTILGGCVQVMDFTGNFMGMEFHGKDQLTYNRETQRFESVWVDDMSGSFMMMHGGFEGSDMVLTGETMRMGQKIHARATSKKISDDVIEWIMMESYDGGETWNDSMQMTYTRKK